MKIAICFAGVVGGSDGKGGKGKSDSILKIGYDHYKQHILDKNDADIFVHTWTLDRENDIKKLYQPKLMRAERQKIFSRDPSREFRKNSHFSRWYSTKKAIGLKRKYEQDHGFKYDCVMVTRFDIAWNIDVVFSNFDMSYFYTSYWDKVFNLNGRHIPNKDFYKLKYPEKCTHELMGYPHDKNGLLDLWFFSNSDTMDKFASLFDNMKQYLLPGNCPKDSAGWISNHQLSLYHLNKCGLKNKIKFAFHYGVHDKEDYSLIRRKYFNSER